MSRKRQKEEAAALERLEREFHPSPRWAVAAGKQRTGFDDPGGALLPWEGGWLWKRRVVM